MESEIISIDTLKYINELKNDVEYFKKKSNNFEKINKIQAKKIIDYTLRKDRAIEYIKQNSWSNDIDEEMSMTINPKILLNILEGDENNE